MNVLKVFEGFGRYLVDLRHGRGNLVDTVTGLSEKQKKLILDSKTVLLDKPLDTGYEILIKFFIKFPKYLEFYPFNDVPSDEWKSNKAFLEQSIKLMNALETWVDKLNEPEELKKILEESGKEYVELNFSEQYFLDLGETIIEHLVPLMDKKTLEAWKRFIGFAMKTMVSSLKR